MEEDEFVISSWQRPDSRTEFNEATEKRFINKKPSELRASKENVENLNLRLDSGETGNRNNMKFNSHNSEDDEVSLDDDVLSRLIEGDLKSEEDALSKSRPKPKPRHKESSNTPRNDSANKRFSGKNEKTDVHHSETSPRPVPRPRAKPILKENLSGSFSNKNNLGDSGNAFKLSADKLFDSKGKGNKTVSFHDLSDKHDTVPKSEKKFGDIKRDSGSGLKEDLGKKRSSETSEKKLKSPPTKPIRTKSKSLGDKKAHEADTVHSQESSHVPGQRRPPPRHPKDHFKQHNSPAHPASKDSFDNGPSHKQQHVSEREWNSNGFTNGEDFRENLSFGQQEPHGRNMMRNNGEDFNVKNQRFVERMEPRDDNVSAEGSVSQKQFMERGQNITAITHLDNEDFERSEHGRLMNSKPSPRKRQDLGNSQKDFRKGQDVTQMFEEHVPNTENMLGQTEQRNKRQGDRIEGKYKNTPLKAEKRLEEMTKSPELYNFQYDSRDTPQNLKYTSLKSSGDSGLSAKRSSSLTNLDDWRNTESDEDKEDSDGLESWRSGFTTSTSIRQAVYNEWLERKRQGLKDTSRKKMEEKKSEEEKLKEKEERQLTAKKAFEAWSSSKEEAIKEHVKKKKEVKDKEIDEKREKMVKRKDAKKFFESWKSKKDELLKESYKEKKTNEKDEKHKEIEDKQEKIDIAKKSYEKWKAKKDEQIKEEVKNKRRGDKLQTKYEKEAEKEKRVECERTFQEFMKKKGMWKRPPPSPTLTQRAWCPGGLTKGTNLIPGNIQSVIPTPRMNRSRSFSGTSTTLR